MSQMIKAPPQAITTVKPAADSTDEARAQLVAARERLAQKMNDVERALSSAIQWREVVKRHPLVTFGGAFLFGYALSKFFSRK